MKRALVALTAIGSMIMISTISSVAYAAPASSSPTGYDVSYPDCHGKLPSGQAFGIVGVNGGIANTTNPCLAKEVAWAQVSSGKTGQPPLAFYVNTGDPGNLGVADWPQNNTDPATGNSVAAADPYGTCGGGDNRACAWQYGWNMADLDAQLRAASAGITNPGSYMWWLDVETGNSWETGSTGLQNNVADLEGMVAYFQQNIGGQVGIYSTTYQWGLITGTTSSSSFYGLADWIPGARKLSQAKANCSSSPLTGGGTVAVTQWTASIDSDYSCQ